MKEHKPIKMRLQFNRPEEQVHTVECMMCGAQGDKEFMKEHLQPGTKHHYITSQSFWIVDENFYKEDRVKHRVEYRARLQDKFERRAKKANKKKFYLPRFTVAEDKRWLA